MTTQAELWAASYAADKAWMDAIRRTYPNERAGDVRYTRAAVATPELKALRDDWQAKNVEALKGAGFLK